MPCPLEHLLVSHRRSSPFPAAGVILSLSRIDALAQPHAAPIQIAATAACAFVVDMGEVGPGRKAATVLDVAVERGGHPEREQEGVGPAVEMQDNVGLR